MEKERYILFTAGKGPIECSLAVQGIQSKFKKHLDDNLVSFSIIQQTKGDVGRSIETILFKVSATKASFIDPWIGTLLWISQSPIRKFHKRKNWYIRCEEVIFSDAIRLSPKDVTVQTFRGSGPGGQHRNKVETAVRLIHKQSGIIVTATDAKSQLQNKKKAWIKLAEQIEHQNNRIKSTSNSDRWAVLQEIERGKQVKTFIGKKFNERYDKKA